MLTIGLAKMGMRVVELFRYLGMVRIMCWNIRGLNAPNKQREVKSLCRNEEVGLVGLLETKVKRNKIVDIATKIFEGWQYITNLDAHYNGRVLIGWRPDFYNIVPIIIDAQIVTCEVKYIPTQITCIISFVYAFNTKEERKTLWTELITQSNKSGLPWLVVGDFNLVLSSEDRLGGNLVTWEEVIDFKTFLDTCGLMELAHGGQRYTWNDKGSD